MIKRKIFSLIIITASAGIVFHLSSCTKNKGIPGTVQNPEPDTLITTVVQFNRDIKPLMTTYCLGTNGQNCHVSNTNIGANGNFENYEGLKEKVDNGSIKTRVLDPGADMPPSYSTGPQTMPANDKAVLKAWMDQGALNN